MKFHGRDFKFQEKSITQLENQITRKKKLRQVSHHFE